MYLRPYKEVDEKTILGWLTDEKGYYEWSAGRLGAYPPAEHLLEQYASEHADNPNVMQMCACIDDEVTGYLVMILEDCKSKIVRLDYQLVDNNQRHKGYGSKMMHLALHYAFEVLGSKKVVATVLEGNSKAIHSYLNAGFVELRHSKNKTVEIMGELRNCRDYETFSVEGAALTTAIVDETEDLSIKEILDNNHFRYAFQPIVSAQSGEIVGYEALMRAESNGPVSPLAVLEYARRTNRLYDIEKATFTNVLRNVEERISIFGNRKIFINSLPGFQLSEDDFQEIRNQYAPYFRQLTVEITEATELTDDGLNQMIERSKDTGFGIAIDDYGTGFSNTGNLLRYSPNCVKIDRLLISDIHQDMKKQHFVKSIVDFAKANGFQTLAEGVETSAELHTVITIGVDLIQGYYTAKPSFDVMTEISAEIQNEIINANVRGQTASDRKIYQATKESEVPLMRVALEKNTGMLIAQENFTIVGNPNYVAAMNIKIKDGLKCRLTIRDVFVESFQDMPCIELGENVDLTLVLEGQNSLGKVGICVPATSSLVIEGDGNLHIHVRNIHSFGIGNRMDSLVGDIKWRSRGFLDILVEAEDAMAIGGGQFAGRKGIELTGGKIRAVVSSEEAIAVGCVSGDFPISISNVDMTLEMNAGRSIGIGCRDSKANVSISVSRVVISGAGNILSGIGGIGSAGADINISSSSVMISANARTVYLLGTANGETNIKLMNSNVELKGEGAKIMGMGSRKGDGYIYGERTNCTVSIRSGEHMLFGALEENVDFQGGTQKFDVNT